MRPPVEVLAALRGALLVTALGATACAGAPEVQVDAPRQAVIVAAPLGPAPPKVEPVPVADHEDHLLAPCGRG